MSTEGTKLTEVNLISLENEDMKEEINCNIVEDDSDIFIIPEMNPRDDYLSEDDSENFRNDGEDHIEKRIQITFVCSLCRKHFTRKGNLITHLRLHFGEKPFKCHLCGQLFSVKGNLKKHMVFHTGQKKFACESCGKRFSSKSNLSRHMMIHTGERPFECTFCCLKFAQKVSLEKHLLNNKMGTNGLCKTITNLECNECPAKFKTLRAFQKHESCHK